jgi:muramidase (phage lysozyme)
MAVSTPVLGLDPDRTAWSSMAADRGIPAVLLYAVAGTETGRPAGHAARISGEQVLRGHTAVSQSRLGDAIDLWRASLVLDLVAGPESGGNYNAWYGNARQNDVHLADLTLDEVRRLQARLLRRHGGSAIGRYQIIARTLEGLITRMGLTGKERFTPALQDRMALHLAHEAGLGRWLTEALSDERFAANLARVWAGLPGDESNRSVYAGLQGNRSGIRWGRLVAALRAIRVDGSRGLN